MARQRPSRIALRCPLQLELPERSGQADLTADLMDDKYAISLNGGLSGPAGWFFRGSGSARS